MVRYCLRTQYHVNRSLLSYTETSRMTVWWTLLCIVNQGEKCRSVEVILQSNYHGGVILSALNLKSTRFCSPHVFPRIPKVFPCVLSIGYFFPAFFLIGGFFLALAGAVVTGFLWLVLNFIFPRLTLATLFPAFSTCYVYTGSLLASYCPLKTSPFDRTVDQCPLEMGSAF